jgi:ABC-type Fe3+-hydroxamate transport system substrate-binding protein
MAALWVLAATGLIGCSDRPTSAPPAAPGSENEEIRIVCLSPALTQMLTDLDLSGNIVGVGEVDPVAPPQAQPVGHFLQMDYEKLIALKPTDLVLQDTRNSPLTGKLRTLAARHGWRIWQHELETTDDVLHALPSLGAALHRSAEAQQVATTLAERMRRVRALTATQGRQRVLLVVNSEPHLTAAAPGTYLDSILDVAGGVNAITTSGVLYPALDAERVLALAPQIVVHLRMPGSRQTPGLPAALTAPVVFLDDATALLPSSSMDRVAARLAGLLHPGLVEQIERIMHEGAGRNDEAGS